MNRLAERQARWAAKTTTPAAELGRVVRLEDAQRRFDKTELQALLDATLTADDLALEVTEDLAELPGKRGRELLKVALDHGIDAVPDAPDSVRRLFASVERVPEWVDFDQLRRGSIAYLRGGSLVSFALASAVVGANERAYGITRSLVFTGRMSGKLAAMRARETTRWLLAATRADGMLRFSDGFKLTVEVRMMHARARRALSQSPLWDWDGWGMPLSDADGVYAICYDFTQALIDAFAAVGIRWSQQELEDISALWRYIGYVVGVPAHLLPQSAAEARHLAEMYLAIDPGPDDRCREAYHARMRFAAGLASEPLDMFPESVGRLLPPNRRLKVLYGFTRYWMGGRLADALAVPDTRWKHFPRLLRPILGLVELGRTLRLLDDEKLAAATVRRLEKACAPAVRDDTRARGVDRGSKRPSDHARRAEGPARRQGPGQPALSAKTHVSAQHEAHEWSEGDIAATIPERFARQAARRPGHPAIAGPGQSTTYAELEVRAARYAAFLHARGHERGRVALLLGQGTSQVAAALASLSLRSAVAVLNPADPPARLAQILAEVEPQVVITEDPYLQLARDAGISETQLVLLSMVQAGAPGPLDQSRARPDDLAFLIATSGSTGRPKFVMHTHRSMLHQVLRYTNGLGLRDDDRVAWLFSLSGGRGLGATWSTLLGGATLCPFSTTERGVLALAEWLEEQKVTLFDALPSLLRSLGRVLPDGRRIRGVRLVRLTSEPAFRSDFATYRRHFPPDSVLVSALASSEAGMIALARIAPEDEVADGRLPVGRPADGLELLLLDDQRRPVGPGEVGEIVVAAEHLALGYWRDQRFTDERFRTFDGRRWLFTGDFAAASADGSLSVLGRADTQVKVRGNRIQLEEVETVLASQPGVAAAAVALQRAHDGDEELVAYVVRESGMARGVESLRRSLRALLPAYAVPSRFVPVSALPLTGNGKLDRQGLLELGGVSSPAAVPRSAQSSTEQLLAEAWSEALDRESIDLDLPFADLGGDSLSAAEIAASVRELFGVDLGLDVFDPELTVARMAALIDQGQFALAAGDGVERIRPIEHGGVAPLSYAQEAIWELAPTKGAGWNMTSGLRLIGELDVKALERSLDEIVHRHEILRTGFAERNGEPMAMVHAHAKLPLPVEDLRSVSDPAAHAQELLQALAEEPFELAQPPLLRFRLVRLSESEHWLLRSAHHLICDAPSWMIFLEELAALYEAQLGNGPSPLAEMPSLQFTDYVLWERENVRPASARWEAEVDWWEQRLRSRPTALKLPFALRPSSAPPSGAHALAETILAPEASSALDRLGRDSAASFFMTRLAAFSALAALEGGNEDLVLDVDLTLRRFAGLQTMIGPLFNKSVLRLRFSERLGFRDWIATVRGEVIDTSLHGWVPFDRLIDELQQRGVGLPSRGVRMAVDVEARRLRFGDLEVERLPRRYISPWGLSLDVKRDPAGDRWRASFDAATHDPDGVRRLLARLRVLIPAACATPDRPLGELRPSIAKPSR